MNSAKQPLVEASREAELRRLERKAEHELRCVLRSRNPRFLGERYV